MSTVRQTRTINIMASVHIFYFMIFLCHYAYSAGFGTMVVVDFSNDYVVVGADSKVSDGNTGQELPNECKIVKLGDHGFFAGTGYQLNGLRIAKEVSAKDGSYKDMLDDWVHLMIGNFATLFKMNPDAAMWKRRILSDGIFGGEEDGNIVVYASTITFDRDDGGFGIVPYTHLKPGMWETFGQRDQTEKYFHEFFHAKTYRAKQEFENIQETAENLNATAPIVGAIVTDRLLHATIEWSAGTIPAIGGPIAVLEIEKGKTAHWFRQPTFCED